MWLGPIPLQSLSSAYPFRAVNSAKRSYRTSEVRIGIRLGGGLGYRPIRRGQISELIAMIASEFDNAYSPQRLDLMAKVSAE